MAHFFSLAYHGLYRNRELHAPTWAVHFTANGHLQSSYSVSVFLSFFHSFFLSFLSFFLSFCLFFSFLSFFLSFFPVVNTFRAKLHDANSFFRSWYAVFHLSRKARILGHPKVHCHIHKSPPRVPFPGPFNPYLEDNVFVRVDIWNAKTSFSPASGESETERRSDFVNLQAVYLWRHTLHYSFAL